ncbi:MAG: 2-amino-4-hydroxy-6-hydroxymethyldihydropteridine diphosphokinase [Clostridiales bacterium]|nr:2-amino-4-hydroxy-6-hydroxymethyldihydropteridine diphosphokinase [Clostridiales bacterium]
MSIAVIGMGTNMGKRFDNLKKAVEALKLLPDTQLINVSHVYETIPVSEIEQPKFLNLNIELETNMSPMALLGACLGIEAAMGRVRTVKNGPRIIDLDLLLYEGVKSESFELTLPHPRILERAFVMVPMKDLFPEGRAPGLFFEPYLKGMSYAGVKQFDRDIEI